MDELYPNDGQAFDGELDEQTQEENQERADTQASAPIIAEFIEELEQEIKNADSLSALGIDSSTPAIQVQILIEANKKYVAMLETKLHNLKQRKDMYIHH